MLDALRQDLRYAIRSLASSPGFTALATLTLALGVGANTAIFGVLDGVLLKPLPFGGPERLVVVWETSEREGVEKSETSAGLFLDWREGNRTLEDLTAWTYDTVVMQQDEESLALDAVLVHPSFFSVLRLDPLFGRAFLGEDAPPAVRGQVALLSHRLWQERFDADPAVAGRAVRVDGEPLTIVGVMRGDIAAPDENADLWIPVGFQSPIRWERHSRRFTVYGRLRPDATVEQAQEDFSRIATEMARGEYADIYKGWDARVVPLHEEIVGGVRARLVVALAAVGVILLIACVNVASMLLARATERRREMAVRTSLGAARGRILVQLLTESVLLAALGGVVGWVVAVMTHEMLLRFEPGIIPRAEELSLDFGALLFAFGVSFVAGIVFGLAPALSGSRLDVNTALKDGGGRMAGAARSSSGRDLMVAAQLALATVLLCGAGLLVRTLFELERIEPGFDVDNRVALRMFLDNRRYDSDERVGRYYAQLTELLERLPYVRSAGATTALPMDPLGISYDLPYRLEAQEALPYNELPQADFRVVTPRYFETMGVPLVAGRPFDDFDRSDTKFVALVNETMARQVWPGGDALGKRFETPSTDWHEFEVVGVVGDTRYYGLRSEPRAEIYVAHAQVPRAIMTFVARTQSEPWAFIDGLRREVLRLDPAQPVHSLVPLEALVSDDVAAERFYTLVLGSLASVALVLAGAGVFGVVSYTVAARTREIGLRMALGATRSGILGGVLARAVSLGVLGAFFGLVAALASTRVFAAVLFNVSTTDASTLIAVATLLLATATAACLVPALRASRVDPIVALREE